MNRPPKPQNPKTPKPHNVFVNKIIRMRKGLRRLESLYLESAAWGRCELFSQTLVDRVSYGNFVVDHVSPTFQSILELGFYDSVLAVWYGKFVQTALSLEQHVYIDSSNWVHVKQLSKLDTLVCLTNFDCFKRLFGRASWYRLNLVHMHLHIRYARRTFRKGFPCIAQVNVRVNDLTAFWANFILVFAILLHA